MAQQFLRYIALITYCHNVRKNNNRYQPILLTTFNITYINIYYLQNSITLNHYFMRVTKETRFFQHKTYLYIHKSQYFKYLPTCLSLTKNTILTIFVLLNLNANVFLVLIRSTVFLLKSDTPTHYYSLTILRQYDRYCRYNVLTYLGMLIAAVMLLVAFTLLVLSVGIIDSPDISHKLKAIINILYIYIIIYLALFSNEFGTCFDYVNLLVYP